MPKCGELLNIGHIGCLSHIFHLSVKDSLKIFEGNPNNILIRAIEDVQKTMKDVKAQGKSYNVLREHTKLRPMIMVKDR